MTEWVQVQFKRPVLDNGTPYKPTDMSVIRRSVAEAHAKQGDLVILGDAAQPLTPDDLAKAEGDVNAGVVKLGEPAKK